MTLTGGAGLGKDEDGQEHLRAQDSKCGWAVRPRHYLKVLRLCRIPSSGIFCLKRVGRVLLTEIQLPRIARQGAVCLISTRGQTRKDRIEKFELDAGVQPYHPPLPIRARPRETGR